MNKKIILAGLAITTGTLLASASEWVARPLSVTQVTRHPSGRVASVDLAFGAANGLTNNLYVAWGDSDGGDRIGGWQHWKHLGEIADDVTSFRATVPTAECCRFFLDVPFGVGVFGEPVKSIVGDGTAYVDVRVKIRGGDELKVTFNPGQGVGGVMGTRTALNQENVNLVMVGSNFTMDYNSNTLIPDNYATYRLTGVGYSTEGWYDIELSAVRRRVYSITGGAETGLDPDVCPDEFETTGNCYLFRVSGSPSVTDFAKGKVSAFSIKRSGDFIVSFLPFRMGETYGFFDRARGVFFPAEQGGDFSGEEDSTLVSPLTSSTETIAKDEPTAETTPRTIAGMRVEGGQLVVEFGPDNGVSNRLYLAYGRTDGGETLEGWDGNTYVGLVDSEMSSARVDIPADAKFCRAFLYLPFEGDIPPVQLQYVTGDGTGYFNAGFKARGGDDIELKVRPSQRYNRQIFGCRSSSDANEANVVFLLNGNYYFQLDYTGGECLNHRCTTTVQTVEGNWYEIKASPSVRSVTLSGSVIGANDKPCDSDFETAYNCYLFAFSGYQTVSDKFCGDISVFKVARKGIPYLTWQPCRIGETYGFMDLVGGGFNAAAEGTFTGADDTSISSMASISPVERVNRKGLMLLFR